MIVSYFCDKIKSFSIVLCHFIEKTVLAVDTLRYPTLYVL